MPDIFVPTKPKPVEVPLTLKGLPALVRRHRTKEDDPIIDQIERTATDLQTAAEALVTAHTRIMGNQLAAAVHNAINARKVIAQPSQTALVKLDKQRAYVESAIARLEQETRPRPKKDTLGAVAAIEAMEIRNALRSMTKPAERLKAVHDAVELGHEDFVHAAVTGLPTLSGLSATEQALLIDYWGRHWHGETMERTRRLKSALSDLDRGGTLYGTFTGKIDVDLKKQTAAAEEFGEVGSVGFCCCRVRMLRLQVLPLSHTPQAQQT